MTNPLAAALLAYQAGLCVVPPKEDGSKAPMGQWKRYQKERPSIDEINKWYEVDHRRGMGVICGAISGNLEMLEFEGNAVRQGLQQQFRQAANDAGVGELLDSVLAGYTERTPSGGFHCLYKCLEPVEGNLKLARRPATQEELRQNPADRVRVLIETRGEGGYVITAPSNGGVHPTGEAWVLVAGNFASLAILTPDQRDTLLDLARSFDEMPRRESDGAPGLPHATADDKPRRPGDDYNARTSWASILEGHGWTRAYTAKDGRQHWRRPGKLMGTSGTVSENGNGLLYVFSTSTPFDPLVSYTKFGAYTVLEHGGDFRAATRALAASGYGEQRAQATSTPAAETQVVPIVSLRSAEPDAPNGDLYHGLVARMTALISPYVESNEAAVLTQFLVAFGIAVGTGPHCMVGATRHAPALYLGLVGKTSRARKGTSWDPIESLFRQADPLFAQRVMSGVGSGERLVYLVRDPKEEEDKEGNSKVVDPGAQDRRLLLQEPELARLLTVVNREGSTMSAYLRSAYDGKPLRNEVKTGGSVASKHHIGLVGHCTSDDLAGQLREQEVRNGLANRILWITARRDKKLADPPIFAGQEVEEAATELRVVLDRAKRAGLMRRHAAAQRLWNEWYLALPDGGTSMLDAITSRRESLVIRASMIFALTDTSEIIGVDHLRAAFALDELSMRCATFIFGGGTGHAIADRILEELRSGPMFKSEITHELFHRNLPAGQLLEAQKILERRGLLVRERVIEKGRPGRPAEQWRMP